MTDQTPPAGTPTGATPGPQQATPQIQILAQYIKDLSFENPNAPGIFLNRGQTQPQMKVNVDVKTNQAGENRYEVVLTLKAEATQGEQTAFLAELSYAGVVQIGADVPKAQVGLILLVQVPTMIFPAARNVIADATRDGGFPPLLVQPVDFVGMFRRQMEALRQQQGGGAAPAGTPAPQGPAGTA